jgi:hypothetical protein
MRRSQLSYLALATSVLVYSRPNAKAREQPMYCYPPTITTVARDQIFDGKLCRGQWLRLRTLVLSDFVNASLLQLQAAARSPFGTISPPRYIVTPSRVTPSLGMRIVTRGVAGHRGQGSESSRRLSLVICFRGTQRVAARARQVVGLALRCGVME